MLITRPLALVYQMPKTGSQTVETTLKASSLPHLVFRCHYLSRKNAEAIRATVDTAPDLAWKRDALAQLELLAQLSRALRIRRWLRLCGAPIPRIHVVSAVRDVIGASLSTLFENFVLFVPRPELLTAEKCRELLSDTAKGTCTQFQDWFDLELKRHIGINVYSTPFSWSEGYRLYHNRFAHVLVYRFESISRLLPVLREFLAAPIDALASQNLSESKPYADHYSQVKSALRLPRQFVSEQLESKLMRHFYSPQERDALAAKWGDNEGEQSSNRGETTVVSAG
jgi:hypothetical protein